MVNKNTSPKINNAIKVLKANDQGIYTQPAEHLYPHQWLWDSCFTAIGLRHVDIERAKIELKSLLRGQWLNGMLPCIIFKDDPRYRADRDQWRSWISPNAPTDVTTSGLTQPPMLAEAIVSVGEKLSLSERRSWYKFMYPSLLKFHEWLYAERDPHSEGLTIQIHPWETGMDNSPPWMSELHEHLMPLWIRMVEKLHLDSLVKALRTDTKQVPLEQRTSIAESLAMFDTQLRLRRKSYNINRILDHSLFAIEDLSYNCILIRANTHLVKIAETIGEKIPEELLKLMDKSAKSLEELWDPFSEQYYSRDFVTHRLIKVPSIASLMPLYSGVISEDRAKSLVRVINDTNQYKSRYPLPSVPLDSFWFDSVKYWQGPTWINTNWLIINGLKQYGFNKEAEDIKDSSLHLVEKSGFYKYFNPLSGHGLGINNFSWTASLYIDLVES